MPELLNETVCPVCGNDLINDNGASDCDGQIVAIWAVAHYLAHIVQQNMTPKQKLAAEFADIVPAMVHGVGFTDA